MKFSIIVPVYNVGQELPRCVSSLLVAIDSEDEIILVNDGSTDHCALLCNQYAAANQSIKAIHKQNGGLSSARNCGICTATGEYILFVDSDDTIAPDSICKLKQIVKQFPNVDFVQFQYLEITDKEESKPVRQKDDLIYSTDRHSFFELLQKLGGCGASACTKLIRKTLFNTISFEEGIIHEDEHFTTQLLSIAESGVYLPDVLYYYHIRDNSIVTSKFHSKKLDIFISLDHRLEILDKLGFRDLYQIELLRYARICLNLYYQSRLNGYTHEAKIVADKLSTIIPLHKLTTATLLEKLFFYLSKSSHRGCKLYYALRRIKNKGIKHQFSTGVRLIIDKIIKLHRRCFLKNKNFSIISNNCWGGFIYQHYGLQYTSPTVGLLIQESDYIRMLENLKTYMEAPLAFIDPSESKHWDKITEKGKNPIKYPVARLIDIDIFFMHYHTAAEAEEKWSRRVKRINWDNLIIKMSQRNDCDEKVIDRFSMLPFKRKFCFVEPKFGGKKDCIAIPELDHINKMISVDETKATLSHIKLASLLNK